MTEIGKRPLLVAKDQLCEECGRQHDFEVCPECGSWVSFGFGLAYGGYGPYAFCNNEACAWFWKQCAKADEE